MENNSYDLIVVGSGPSGLIAAITAARGGKSVLVLEKMPKPALKLKASGGGRCNLSNTLTIDQFLDPFGKSSRFMRNALENFTKDHLVKFLDSIGVKVKIADGFRIFPSTHNSQTVTDAFIKELDRLNITLITSCEVLKLYTNKDKLSHISTTKGDFKALNYLVATGGCGYETLGGSVNSFDFIKEIGHTITPLYPAMIPIKLKESWVSNCKADTIPKATIKIDIKKYSRLNATGDLIFTNSGIRGPVVLDFSRYITPLFNKYDEIPLLVNLTQNRNEDQLHTILKDDFIKDPKKTIVQNLLTILPLSLSKELLKLVDIKEDEKFNKLNGQKKQNLLKTVAWTPLNAIGTDGFSKAMVTNGGVSLKQIDQNSMGSKIFTNLYFAGEVLDIDGPCGGYNLQWAFSSGVLAAKS